MATGRAGRAERLNQRLRGAQRANVEADDLFDFAIPSLDQTQGPVRSSPLRQPARSSPLKRKVAQDDPSEQIDSPAAEPTQNTAEPLSKRVNSSRGRKSGPRSTGIARNAGRPPSATGVGGQTARTGQSTTNVSAAKALAGSPARPRQSSAQMEEVSESPAHAPGSGRRRRLEGSALRNSSAQLQEMMESNAVDISEGSSPLASKSRRSDALATGARRSSQMETIPEPPSDEAEEPAAEVSPGRRRQRLVANATRGEVTEADADEAEEIDTVQAAKTIGVRRPRESIGRPSPELGSPGREPEVRTKATSVRRPAKSPAKQKQPAPKPTKAPKRRSTAAAKPASRKPKTSAKRSSKHDSEAEGADEPIEITVQRFINMKADGLAEIPHANRSGESVIDVFAQVCEEVIAHTLAQLAQQAETAPDNKEKKIIRIKMRAIEAYREEISSRLLQHAIHLNHWHSVRKRVRHVQKEKLALRDEILRLRKEREQVALRVDAVRTKHEEDNNDATYRLDMSALMQDIELAVEQGKDAPEPSRMEKQEADLGNLEWAISHIADQASSQGVTGGILNQLKDFNGFLERAASALETK